MNGEGYEALNYKKNSEIYSQLGHLEELRLQLTMKIEHKQSKLEKQMNLIERTKQDVYGKIDNFFNKIVEIAQQRKDQLKSEYLSIEEKEQSHIAGSLEKVRLDNEQLSQISMNFAYFYSAFSDAEDFNKNTENLYFYQNSYHQVQKQIERKANFYKLKGFKSSEFKCIESDLLAVQKMGKIMDNSLADAPLVLFDAQKFAAYEYKAKGSTFKELPLIDTENFAERIPKDFKSIYVGGVDQSFLLVGGFSMRKQKTSNEAFLYQKGKLKEVIEMYLPRQFFGICSNLTTELAASSIYNKSGYDDPNQPYAQKNVVIFVIGGFNDSQGCLKEVESFSTEQRVWRQHSPMNTERINPGCCTFDKQYVYVFGGRSAEAKADFYDSIERFNVDLNLWSFFKIRLPDKLCNLYAFTVKQDYIMVMGGLKRVKYDQRTGQEVDPNSTKSIKEKYVKFEQQIDSNVYLYSHTQQVWFNLRPLSKQMKVCNVVPTGDCRFNCFLLQKPAANSQAAAAAKKKDAVNFPLNVVYDLKIVCPRLDRYWYFDHMQKAKQRKDIYEMDSQRFLKDMSGRDNTKGQGDDQPVSQDYIVNDTDNNYLVRNFEWERRHGNFIPETFGVEMNQIVNQQNVGDLTADSLLKQTDFDKAAESGEIDAAMLLSCGQSLRRDTIEFAKLSRDLGKKKDVVTIAEDQPNEYVQQKLGQQDNPDFGSTQLTAQHPAFGHTLAELGGTAGNEVSEEESDEEDLISAFR